MKNKIGDTRKKGTTARQESTAIEPSRQGVVPYSLGDRKDTEDYFKIKFRSERHYQYFCWCLSNNWLSFSNQALIFGWGSFTRPLSSKIQKEWWYIEGRKRSNSRWRQSGFDRRFVQKMMNNLVRCGIFTIEGDIWTFKGFPQGWERKWRKAPLPV